VLVIAWVLFQAGANYFPWAVMAAGGFTAASWTLYLIDGLHQLESGHKEA